MCHPPPCTRSKMVRERQGQHTDVPSEDGGMESTQLPWPQIRRNPLGTLEALGLERTALMSLIRTQTQDSAQSCLLPRLLPANPSFLLLHDHIRVEKARRPLGRSRALVLLPAGLLCSGSRTWHPGPSSWDVSSPCHFLLLLSPLLSESEATGRRSDLGHLRTSDVDFSRNMSFLFIALNGVKNLKLSL